MTGQFRERVSVIIPVHNNTEGLRSCLDALTNQSYPKELYEIITVDSNSTENIKQVVDRYRQVVFTSETEHGSYAARNKGISLAKGEILAFTDSDCIPASDWIEKGVANLLCIPRCGLVAGRVRLFFKDPSHPTAVELYDYTRYLQQRDFVEKYKFGATANLFTFKKVIDEQ